MIKIIFSFLLFLWAAPLGAADVQMITSEKGVRAWLVEDHSLPLVALSFSWQGGLEQDAPDKEGLSFLTAAMLDEGAGADDSNVFQKKLQDNAISLGFSAGRDSFGGQMRSLKETWPVAVKMLHDSLHAPRFDADAIVRQKAQMASLLKSNLSDPDWLLSRLMISEIFKGHAYERRALGTEASLKILNAADLKKRTAYLSRDGMMVALTGDITPEESRKMLDDVFADLPQKSMVQGVPEAVIKTGETVLLRHKGPQSALMLVWPGLKRDEADWYKGEVLNYILGGGSFSSRLMAEIREKRGLTYGISSSPMFYEHAGLYMVETSTPNDKVPEVLSLIEKEIARLRDEKVDAEELQAAKDYLIGSFPLQLTSTAKVAAHYQALQRLKLGVDEQTKRAAAIKAVSAEDVQKLASRIFANKYSLFIVGEPQGVSPTRTLDALY